MDTKMLHTLLFPYGESIFQEIVFATVDLSIVIPEKLKTFFKIYKKN